MTEAVGRIIPSQDVRLGWLAGIIDGEGTIAHYKTNQGHYINGVVIVNTDEEIIAEIISIYKALGIHYSKNLRKRYKNELAYSRLPCYEVVVRRKKDIVGVLELVTPYLIGKKQLLGNILIEYLVQNPNKRTGIYICEVCGVEFKPGRKRRFCSQKCWHNFAKGKDNPNFKHGKRISGVTTKRETPQ